MHSRNGRRGEPVRALSTLLLSLTHHTGNSLWSFPLYCRYGTREEVQKRRPLAYPFMQEPRQVLRQKL